LTVENLPWVPDLVIAGVPCTSYSICGIRHHRKNLKPTSEFAVKSDRLVKAVLQLVADLGCPYFIENPRGLLRKMDFMQFSERELFGIANMAITEPNPQTYSVMISLACSI